MGSAVNFQAATGQCPFSRPSGRGDDIGGRQIWAVALAVV
jgi:hypothetical protein